jgi:hypothetical protein
MDDELEITMDVMLRIKAIVGPRLAELYQELASAFPTHPADAYSAAVGYAVGATIANAVDAADHENIRETINHLLPGYRLEPTDGPDDDC